MNVPPPASPIPATNRKGARPALPVVAWAVLHVSVASLAPAIAAGEVIHVSPADSLAEVSERLASDPFVSEVVLAGGVYRQTLVVPPPRSAGDAVRPLLIRPAEGALVVFDGAQAIPRARPVRGRAGVYSVAQWSTGPQPPRLWEPDRRIRYGLAADLDAVTRFAATYVIEGGKVYFHTSDGQAPAGNSIHTGALDQGILIRRAKVTVRDLEFRNFVAQGKWSAGINVDGDQVTVERCTVSHASFGFTFSGKQDALVDCTVRDVGGGVYLSGVDGRVEGCRFIKSRDAFLVPAYPQDDTGIQFYFPAVGGVVERNLVVGFASGILIKSWPAPWRVERNTLVGAGQEVGFLATAWQGDATFRQNIVAGFASDIEIHQAAVDRSGIARNCTSVEAASTTATRRGGNGRSGDRPAGRQPPLAIEDAGFVDPALDDYRLDPASPCAQAAGGEAVGALPVLDPQAGAPPPRVWHVSPAGRDGADGTEAAPVRTIQHAADHVRPGDTVLLAPGIYPEPVALRRGGRKGAPITIRAARKGTAILDGNRQAATMVAIENAPFVVLRDLEIRWFARTGVLVRDSPAVTVSGCRIWNAAWDGLWPTGTGVQVERSPRFTGDRNELFAQERGFYLLDSPGATITHNTGVANLYGAAHFIYSIEGSVCRNNSFAFQGNDALVIIEREGARRKLGTFDCDHNNYGMTLREQEKGVVFDRIVPRDADRHLLVESKGIVALTEGSGPERHFVSLTGWREFSGLDAHSIFADPLYVATAARDFRLQPDSPNIGAGSDGATIGSHDGTR
jgi:hypothetical protein